MEVPAVASGRLYPLSLCKAKEIIKGHSVQRFPLLPRKQDIHGTRALPHIVLFVPSWPLLVSPFNLKAMTPTIAHVATIETSRNLIKAEL